MASCPSSTTSNAPKAERHGINLALAILTLIIGISLLGDSALAQATFIPFLVGFWMLFAGIARLTVGFAAPKGVKGWLIAGGIATAILGILVMLNPIWSGIALVWLFAIILLVFGVIRVIEFFRKPVA